MASKIEREEIFAQFYDDGEYTPLFADGAVSAACGYANGQQAYAVFQNGAAVTVKDVEKNSKVLEMAAQTGNPVVTFYNSVGAKLEEGLDVLGATARLNAQIARVSGVVPHVAVVLGVCGATSALAAANADVCIMTKDAELFFTAPFTSAAQGDKAEGAGTAANAAKAGVAAIVTETAAEAAEKAAHIVGLLPANNLTGPAIFEFEQPEASLTLGAFAPEKAAAALVDRGSAVELYAGFGKSVYTAFATINGNAVGVVSTGELLCHNCVAKASRFVRLCDAFSVPVVTVVNTKGFVASSADDLAGGIREAARLAATYADATTAKVCLLAGKAVGPVYTAFGAADLRIAVNGSVISALEPSAAVTVLYKDEIDASANILAATQAKAAAYEAEVCSAANAIASGVADMQCDAEGARAAVVAALDLLATKRASRLPKKHGNMAL
jgi:acetyl-CoA carboxylase carboxyltransferase component